MSPHIFFEMLHHNYYQDDSQLFYQSFRNHYISHQYSDKMVKTILFPVSWYLNHPSTTSKVIYIFLSISTNLSSIHESMYTTFNMFYTFDSINKTFMDSSSFIFIKALGNLDELHLNHNPVNIIFKSLDYRPHLFDIVYLFLQVYGR